MTLRELQECVGGNCKGVCQVVRAARVQPSTVLNPWSTDKLCMQQSGMVDAQQLCPSRGCDKPGPALAKCQPSGYDLEQRLLVHDTNACE
eukprot:4471593-Amphidinium_carterae.2